MPKGRYWTPKDITKLISLEERRIRRTDIALILGRTVAAVRGMLVKLGKADRRYPTGELSARVRRMCRPGVSDTDIADAMGLKHISSITNVRKRYGIPPGLSSLERAKLGAAYRWAGRYKINKEKQV